MLTDFGSGPRDILPGLNCIKLAFSIYYNLTEGETQYILEHVIWLFYSVSVFHCFT